MKEEELLKFCCFPSPTEDPPPTLPTLLFLSLPTPRKRVSESSVVGEDSEKVPLHKVCRSLDTCQYLFLGLHICIASAIHEEGQRNLCAMMMAQSLAMGNSTQTLFLFLRASSPVLWAGVGLPVSRGSLKLSHCYN